MGKQRKDCEPVVVDKLAVRTGALGAFALGAVAVGAVAIGAMAIGRLAIGRLALGSGHVKRLTIDELVVKRLDVEGSKEPLD